MRSACALSAAVLPFVLCGCSTDIATAAARAAAKAQAAEVARTRFPGLPVTRFTDCVIDNATVADILALGRATTGSPDGTTIRTVMAVLARPETQTCIAAEGLPILLTRL